MAMLDMFVRHEPKLHFSVVTVDHSLRKESGSDCLFVQQWCAQHGVKCDIVKVDVNSYCREKGVSVETGARILRYEALNGRQCDYICLAHNKDDNAESVLMHIIRGSGLKGATGMQTFSGKYFRPLLEMTKKEVLQYCRDNAVPFVTDSTNSDCNYTRNFLRHKVIPLLKQINGNVIDNIVQFAENVALDQQYLTDCAVTDEVVTEEGKAFIPDSLLRQHPAVAYRVVDKTLAAMGVVNDFNRTHYLSVIALKDKQSGSRVDLPHGLTAYNDYNGVTICKSFATHSDYCLPFKEGYIQLPSGTLYVGKRPVEGFCLRVDAKKIPPDAVIRTRSEGDVFTKFGGGTKPLKKFLIDKKIPARMRDAIPLIASDNRILVVCGVEIADSVKTDDKSEIYYINFTKGKN